jgi:GNAT superfamily N-acetyltransferase
MAVDIRKVESREDFKAFFEFPWTLYKGDPNWVPPLLSMRRDTLDKEKNPAWEYMDGEYFAAWRGNQIVGTIAALINHRHNEFHNERVGWFGAFETIDDAEVAHALLDTAREWVKGRGYDILRGPQTFTTHEETGLLVEGFTRPIILYPYNKPYYQLHVESAGFTGVIDSYGFHLDAEKVYRIGTADRLKRLAEHIEKRYKVVVRQVDRKNLKAEFQLFKDIYNQVWEKNWGFVPMTPRELDAMVKSLGQFFDHRLAFFAYINDKPVGFIIGIPDFNQVLLKAYPKPGTPEIFTLIKALYYWKIRPVIDWGRVPLLGVIEEYRGKGVDVILYQRVCQSMLDIGFKHNDSGWILETNQPMVGISKNIGGEIYHTYRYYEKAVS